MPHTNPGTPGAGPGARKAATHARQMKVRADGTKENKRGILEETSPDGKPQQRRPAWPSERSQVSEGNETMSKNDVSVKATVREFADMIRKAGISPSMREIEVAIAVERLREEHGIEVDADKFDRLVNR